MVKIKIKAKITFVEYETINAELRRNIILFWIAKRAEKIRLRFRSSAIAKHFFIQYANLKIEHKDETILEIPFEELE